MNSGEDLELNNQISRVFRSCKEKQIDWWQQINLIYCCANHETKGMLVCVTFRSLPISFKYFPQQQGYGYEIRRAAWCVRMLKVG